MIFPESFPMFYSLGLVVVLATAIFLWRFYIFKKNLIKTYFSLPSVLVLGTKKSGKTSFIKFLTNSQVEQHPIQDGFNLASLNLEGKEIQFLEVPHFVDGIASNLQKIKGMNLICGVYIFDVSKDSEPIEVQLENFKRIKEAFKDLKFFVFANKMDISDEQKVEKLKNSIGKVYMLSLADSLEKEKAFQLRKELDDVLNLISNLSSETSQQKIELTKP